jgi:hypothetical protein
MPDWLLITLMTLASYRATRLIVHDQIFIGTRTKLQLGLERRKEKRTRKHTDDVWQSKLAYLIGCPWCMGIWVSAIIVWITTFFTSVPLPVLVWAAVSCLVGFLAMLEPNK